MRVDTERLDVKEWSKASFMVSFSIIYTVKR